MLGCCVELQSINDLNTQVLTNILKSEQTHGLCSAMAHLKPGGFMPYSSCDELILI